MLGNECGVKIGAIMFTFGRDHEKKCAAGYLSKPDDIQRAILVVDAVHDLIEGQAATDAIRPILASAFSEGRSGVWEQTGSWICQLSSKFPELLSLWRELSQSPKGSVRFRVACFLDRLPRLLAIELGEKLKVDRHQKTKEMAIARMQELGI